jgi:diaminopimelate decarboxylase
MRRLQLFPETVRVEQDGLSIGGCDLTQLAEKFGTPLYVYDAATLETAVQAYQRSLAECYPGRSSLTYAGKAFLCLALAEWIQQHGLWLDCSSLGEIVIAAAAGLSRERLVVHGVNKTEADLEAARSHAGVIVVDNLAELEHLLRLPRSGIRLDLWLRLQPGVAVETHRFTQTGQEDSKFGMPAQDLLEAARLCQENSLPYRGIHFHLGSQIRSPDPFRAAIEKVLDLAKETRLSAGWCLSPGGGWGEAYHEEDLPRQGVEGFVRAIAAAIQQGCQERQLALPELHLEPGRSLIARAGVAVYRVGVVRQTEHRTWVLLDGGLADNPRPALYGARYTALPVYRPDRPADRKVWLAGPYCESADVLIEGLPFPDIQEGELVAVPVSGAYQLSMSSNYNGARRPAVLWLENGQASLIQEREKPEDLFRRDRRLAK